MLMMIERAFRTPYVALLPRRNCAESTCA
ncbi:hypothetical protein M3J09_007899 [Ascochyta lentis]